MTFVGDWTLTYWSVEVNWKITPTKSISAPWKIIWPDALPCLEDHLTLQTKSVPRVLPTSTMWSGTEGQDRWFYDFVSTTAMPPWTTRSSSLWFPTSTAQAAGFPPRTIKLGWRASPNFGRDCVQQVCQCVQHNQAGEHGYNVQCHQAT